MGWGRVDRHRGHGLRAWSDRHRRPAELHLDRHGIDSRPEPPNRGGPELSQRRWSAGDAQDGAYARRLAPLARDLQA